MLTRNLVPFQSFPINMKFVAELLFGCGVQELLFGQYRLTQNVLPGAQHIFTNNLLSFFSQFSFSEPVGMVPTVLKFLQECTLGGGLNLLNRMTVKFTLVDEKEIGSVEFDASALSDSGLQHYPSDMALGGALDKYEQMHIRGLMLQRYLQSFAVSPSGRCYRAQHYCTFAEEASEFSGFVSMGADPDFLDFVTDFFARHPQNTAVIRQGTEIYRPPMTAREYRLEGGSTAEEARTRLLNLGFAKVAGGGKNELHQPPCADQTLLTTTAVTRPQLHQGTRARVMIEPQPRNQEEMAEPKPVPAGENTEHVVLTASRASGTATAAKSIKSSGSAAFLASATAKKQKPAIQQTPQLINPGEVAHPNLYQHKNQDDFLHQISRWTQLGECGVGSKPTVVKRRAPQKHDVAMQAGVSAAKEMSLGRPFLRHQQAISRLDTDLFDGVQPVKTRIATHKFDGLSQRNLLTMHRFSIHKELGEYFMTRAGQRIAMKHPQSLQNAQLLSQLKESAVPDTRVPQSPSQITQSEPRTLDVPISRKIAILNNINIRGSDAQQMQHLLGDNPPSSPQADRSGRGSMDFALFQDGRNTSLEFKRIQDSSITSSKSTRSGHWVASSQDPGSGEAPRPKRAHSQQLAQSQTVDSLRRSMGSTSASDEKDDHADLELFAAQPKEYKMVSSPGAADMSQGKSPSTTMAGRAPNRFQQVQNAEDEATESDAPSLYGEKNIFMLGKRTSVTELNHAHDMSVASTDAESDKKASHTKLSQMISGHALSQLPATTEETSFELAPLSAEALAQVNVYNAMLKEREELKESMKQGFEPSDSPPSSLKIANNDSRANESVEF